MRPTLLMIALTTGLGAAPDAPDDKPAPSASAEKARRDRLQEIYRGEAERYTIFRDGSRKERVTLRPEPVYVWTNPVRGGGQDGAVFVWTCRGRSEAVGCFFTFPSTGQRNLHHELHSLATTVLDVTKPGEKTWAPEAPGIDLRPVPGAPAPGGSASGRLVQMRAILRGFAGNTRDFDERSWELRPLPQPLYRYESTDPEVIDGALFAFVSTAGTDPEVFIVLDARRPAGASSPSWQYAVARFTDLDLWVRYKGAEVYQGKRIHWNEPIQDPKHRYRSFRDHVIPPVEDQTP